MHGNCFNKQPYCTNSNIVSLSSDKCTYCRSLWIKVSANALNLNVNVLEKYNVNKNTVFIYVFSEKKTMTETVTSAVAIGARTQADNSEGRPTLMMLWQVLRGSPTRLVPLMVMIDRKSVV